MRVRNTRKAAVGLTRFVLEPGPDQFVPMDAIASVTIAPGEVQDVPDEFFETEGAKGFLADGTLVDVVAEAEKANEAATAPIASRPPSPRRTSPRRTSPRFSPSPRPSRPPSPRRTDESDGASRSPRLR